MPIRHVVLDFDGTCTQVEVAQRAYLDGYHRLLQAEVYADAENRWESAIADVTALSPDLGWMLSGAAPSAPAAADPYILSAEAAKRVLIAAGREPVVPSTIHARAYEAAEAPWRDETRDVLEGLSAAGVSVCFISNSSTTKIARRLDALLGPDTPLRRSLLVRGDAAKYSIREAPLARDASAIPIIDSLRAMFDGLAPGERAPGLARPIYLRRGGYFEALCRVWNGDPSAPAATLVCGDVWELDLAMPAALGCQVHMIRRRPPHETYEYERQAMMAVGARGGVSDDLVRVLDRVRESRG